MSGLPIGTNLKLLDASVVGVDEIDALGHLNVRGYMARIRRGSVRLLAGMGLDRQDLVPHGASLIRSDTYSRYHQEQVAGAPLEVWGASLGAGAAGIRVLYEVRNATRGDLAASFIVGFAIRDDLTDARLPPRPVLMMQADAHAIALPNARAPRSLRLDPIDRAIEQAVASRLIVETDGRIIERVVYPADADRTGYLDEEEELLFSRSRHGDLPPPSLIGAAFSGGSEGVRLAWPLSETRLISFARPRVDDVIRTISADVALGPKTRTTRRWTINQRDSRLVAVQDAVSVAMDLDRRASVVIPDRLRAGIEQHIARMEAIRADFR